jgi:hypothetical protein
LPHKLNGFGDRFASANQLNSTTFWQAQVQVVLPLFDVAGQQLARFNHVATIIVNANRDQQEIASFLILH